MKKARDGYTEAHASSGLDAKLPAIETWPNQFKGYEITIEVPEYTAICPKTGHIHAYRNIGIFYENAVNRILRDLVAACRPVHARVIGEFSARGGLRSTIEAQYP